MSEIDEMYQAIILDAARERHGEGTLDHPDGESFQMNPVCGDEVTMQVELSEDGERIERVGWTGDGCSISQASISTMHDLVEGQSLDRLTELYGDFRTLMDNRGHELDDDTMDDLEDATAFVGVAKFPMRIKCALLGWMAVREATDNAIEARGENRE